ncbi:response regulator [Herminiimonas sp. KBW02]|uniref:response regulator n=1 Tax=Herminiimonas sp. KBW02 TaxID=2153363 RepID=UPI001F1B757B|nr:response regulator [Herminiimonas sp. KBW02]
MSSYLPFITKKISSAQRLRIARRREGQNSTLTNTQLDERLLEDLQRTVNSQMNGIIGALEMIRQNDLTADQRDMVHLAQSSADRLLLNVAQLLESNTDLGINQPAQGALGSLNGVRMLLIDSNAEVRAHVIRELQQRGARVEGFEVPKIALAALESAALAGDPYRIALFDQNIPGIDGETLGTAIGSSPLYRDTLVVLISDEHTQHDADRLAQAGFSAWLPKPLQQTMLLDTLSLLCSCIAKKDAPRFVCAGVHLNTDYLVSDNAHVYTHTRVLAVDDNPVNLQIAERMLARFGCQVDTAGDGQQALRMVHIRNYDLILMDCQMPNMDGYQTTALLRAAETGDEHVPIVGWSSGVNRSERDTCLAIGMDDFIFKPIRMRPLSDMLSRWLKPASTERSMVRNDDELEATQEMFGADFAELVDLFLTDSPKRFVFLHEAILANDAPTVAKFAHVLCGSTSSIGATTLAALCRELEIRAKNNILGDASLRLTEIELEYARIDKKLRDMLARTAPHVELPPGAHNKL